MILFRVISVTKKSSAEVWTTRFTYDNDERKGTRTTGAEWEVIEFEVLAEDQPTIGVANITGNAFLTDSPKLIVNNPDLFGIYKVGDIIEFMPRKVISEAN